MSSQEHPLPEMRPDLQNKSLHFLQRVRDERDPEKIGLLTSLSVLVSISYLDCIPHDDEDLSTLCGTLFLALAGGGDNRRLHAYYLLIDMILRYGGEGARSLHQIMERLGGGDASPSSSSSSASCQAAALWDAQATLLPRAPLGFEGDACGEGDDDGEEEEEEGDDDDNDDDGFIADADDAIGLVQDVERLVTTLDAVVCDIGDRAGRLSDVIRRSHGGAARTTETSTTETEPSRRRVDVVERFLELLRSRQILSSSPSSPPGHAESLSTPLLELAQEAHAAEERLMAMEAAASRRPGAATTSMMMETA